ncbi:hypothetical protein Tco_1517553 [Tanacetum coccineum]
MARNMELSEIVMETEKMGVIRCWFRKKRIKVLEAEVYDSWNLQGDVEELWDKLAKLGLGLRCCFAIVVPRLNLEPKEVMWPLGSQVGSLRCLCAT